MGTSTRVFPKCTKCWAVEPGNEAKITQPLLHANSVTRLNTQSTRFFLMQMLETIHTINTEYTTYYALQTGSKL